MDRWLSRRAGWNADVLRGVTPSLSRRDYVHTSNAQYPVLNILQHLHRFSDLFRILPA